MAADAPSVEAEPVFGDGSGLIGVDEGEVGMLGGASLDALRDGQSGGFAAIDQAGGVADGVVV